MGQCTGDRVTSTRQQPHDLYQNTAQQEAIDQFYATQVAYLAQKLNGIAGATAARCSINR